MIIKTYKAGHKILCYIKQSGENKFVVCTGKPSDAFCISWVYDNFRDAERTAEEYFLNSQNIKTL